MENRIDSPFGILALGAEFSAEFGDCWEMLRPEEGSVSAAPTDGTCGVEFHPPTCCECHATASGEYQSTHREEGIPTPIGHIWRLVPDLGEIVWTLPQSVAAHVPFRAYICQRSDGQQIGYVRVPHYTLNTTVVQAFEDLIARFESTTAAMVLDQMNNPGGNMFQMHAIASTLTPSPMSVPMHQITIDEDHFARAFRIVRAAEASDTVPADKRALVAYSRFVLSEKAAGRGTGLNPTNPVHLNGEAEISPAKNHYTKRIFVLINLCTLSAGEFLAAILQDNKRATLFGERTAGAGACVKRGQKYYSRHPPFSYTLPWTVAWRTNGQPIENIGVHPDIRYSPTIEDYRSPFSGYRKALLAAIDAELG